MVSKIKKVILASIFALIIGIIYSTSVNALDLSEYGISVGDKIRIRYAENGNIMSTLGYGDFFCIRKGVPLMGDDGVNAIITMTVQDYIYIRGNTSTYNGEEVTCINNGIMAWILNQVDTGSDHRTGGNVGGFSDKQKAIYGFFGTWAKTVGLDITTSSGGYSKPSWVEEARKTYAESIENATTASITDQTNKDSIKTEAMQYNGESYILVGPFKWSYTGDLSNIQVQDQDNNPISGVLYAKYVGNSLEISDSATDIISSENSFYILIKADSGVAEIAKITGQVTSSYKLIIAKIWTLVGANRQNIITTTTSEETESSSVDIDFEYEIPLLIDISGYVWEDRRGGKTGEYDDVYHGEAYTNEEDGQTYDGNDTLVEGITVNLKDQDGNIIQTTTTDENGAYKFTDLFIEDLGNYYVEFVYDGLTYTSVTALVGNDDSINSKASEVVDERKALNSAFTEITNTGDITNRSQGYSRDANGTVTGTITYTNDTENWKSIFESTTYDTSITANTNVTNYSIEEQFVNGNYIINSDGKREIQYINLGIVEREQPNVAISNDIYNVQVDINGYSHTYNYAQRNQYVENTTAFNVAVKFANEYTNTYTRAIYPSDVQYSLDSTDDANKLKVYVTYSIIIRNQSTSLMTSVNEIVNYYDQNYTIVDSWLGDESNKITWTETSKYGQTYNGEEYKGVYTTALAGTKIAAGQNSETIYIKFQVSDDAVLGLLNESATLFNVTEIYSYSTYYGTAKEGCVAEEIYAGIDQASAPGNATPGETDTYEADTDKAPSLILEATGVREIEGTVFEDATADELLSEQERKGDGIYDSDTENTVSGVTVELININSGEVATIYPNAFEDIDEDGEEECVANTTGEAAIVVTEEDGYYIFRGIEPDQYFIKYTYQNGVTKIFDTDGNKIADVTVQDYKSTILTSDTIINAFDNTDTDWYKENVDIRYSDARDNYTRREEIDDQLTELTNSVQEEINSSIAQEAGYTGYLFTTLEASTPEFEMGIEYESVYTSSTGEAYTYRVSNIDFGIVERPRQSVELDKIVKNIRVTLANGQVLIDGDPSAGLDYVIVTDDGGIYVTIDSELIYGAHIEIDYELVISNISEIDYRDESYYYYGRTPENEDSIVKITSATLMDFVDNELIIKATDENGDWTEIANVAELVNEEFGLNLTEEEIEQLLNQYSTVVTAESIPTDTEEDIELEPGDSYGIYIYLERLLATSDELSYENDGEVITITKTGGGNITTTLGNYASLLAEDPSKGPEEIDETEAYSVTIIPPTGLDDSTVTYIIVGITSLVILGAGVYVVRRIVKL